VGALALSMPARWMQRRGFQGPPLGRTEMLAAISERKEAYVIFSKRVKLSHSRKTIVLSNVFHHVRRLYNQTFVHQK
jgi:hypothetical protein